MHKQPQVSDLRVRDAKFNDAVVHGLARLERSKAFLEVRVQEPQLQRLVHPLLHSELGILVVRAHPTSAGYCGGLLHQAKRALVVLMSDFHLTVLHPHGNETLDVLKGFLDGAVKDCACLVHGPRVLVPAVVGCCCCCYC